MTSPKYLLWPKNMDVLERKGILRYHVERYDTTIVAMLLHQWPDLIDNTFLRDLIERVCTSSNMYNTEERLNTFKVIISYWKGKYNFVYHIACNHGHMQLAEYVRSNSNKFVCTTIVE